jgi:hypothetical protein
MHKNFLVIKGMTLMGDGGLKFKRFVSKYHYASRTLPRRWDQSSGNIIQITMLAVDVDPSLGDSHWVGLARDQPDLKPDPVLGYRCAVWRRLWVSGLKNIQSGLDDLFHLASNQTNTVNDFGTIGPYDSGEARHTALFNPPRLRTRRLHCTMQFQHYW